MEIDIEGRLRTMRILWFALLMSIGSFFLFSQLAPATEHEPGNEPSSLLIVALLIVGILVVVMSFVVKRKVLQRSVEKQDLALVQQALVVACAMCEACGLLGLVEHFLIGNREYYLLFLVAAFGTALHFPRREHLLAAMPKIPIGGASS
jgi:predicted MFS family arabinose efflux permease